MCKNLLLLGRGKAGGDWNLGERGEAEQRERQGERWGIGEKHRGLFLISKTL